MKVHLTLALLLCSTLLYAQYTESGSSGEEEPAQRRKSRIHDLEFDRVDYYYKDNLLQYAVQYTGNGGYARTWRYFYQKDGSDALINSLKARYPHKQLHGATQVAFRNSVHYEVIMEDKNRWYVYQADSLGNISLKRKFRKR